MAIYNGGLNIIAPDISGKEDKSNKVTAWSSTTTDTHYPSENLVKSALDTKVNTADVLTAEEILATTDLTGKVASASSVKSLNADNMKFYKASSDTDYRDGYSIGVFIDDTGSAPSGHIIFNISWIRMQFKINDDAIFVRFKYGGSPASEWKLLATK